MDIKIRFFFILAAFICFVLGAFSAGLGRDRANINFVALGLALFVFPALWDTGTEAF